MHDLGGEGVRSPTHPECAGLIPEATIRIMPGGFKDHFGYHGLNLGQTHINVLLNDIMTLAF